MARGWESKSVEAQIDAAESIRAKRETTRLTNEQIQALREREGIELSRKRILHELEQCANPRYKRLLDKTLGELDRKLKALD